MDKTATAARAHISEIRQNIKGMRLNASSNFFDEQLAQMETAAKAVMPDMPQTTKLEYLKLFAQAAKKAQNPTPTEYYPAIVQTLMEELKANMDVFPEATPKQLAGNTVRCGAIAKQLVDAFPDLSGTHIIKTAFTTTTDPEAALAEIQRKLDILKEALPDRTLYPLKNLRTAAVNTKPPTEATEGRVKEMLVARARPAKKNSSAADAETPPDNALEEARAALIEAGSSGTSSITQTFLTNSPEFVQAILARGKPSRSVADWEGRRFLTAQEARNPSDKGKRER